MFGDALKVGCEPTSLRLSSRTKSPRALWHREGLCNEIMSRREEYNRHMPF